MGVIAAALRARREPQPALAGQLDTLRPDWLRPDATVFGDWLPGPQQPWPVLAACVCGCKQRNPGRCWNCGRPVPWQWND